MNCGACDMTDSKGAAGGSLPYAVGQAPPAAVLHILLGMQLLPQHLIGRGARQCGSMTGSARPCDRLRTFSE